MDSLSAWDTPTKPTLLGSAPTSPYGTPTSANRYKTLRVDTFPLSPASASSSARRHVFGSAGSGSGAGGTGSGSSTPASTPTRGDRFIPRRQLFSPDMAYHEVTQSPSAAGLKENQTQGGDSADNFGDSGDDPYLASLQENVMENVSRTPIPLWVAPRMPMSPAEQRRVDMLDSITPPLLRAEKPRHTPTTTTTAARSLQLPGLQDDYYLNLLGWSSRGTLAIALGDTVFLWTQEAGIVRKFTPFADGELVTSLSWSHDGSCLAVGASNAKVQLWDAASGAHLRVLEGHTLRVGSLAWSGNTLCSGSRDTKVLQHDVRLAAHCIARLSGHRQEVCGLQWSRDGGTLASGGNDNLLNVWDSRGTGVPRFTLTQHTAAVKALAWSPFSSTLLASGGGTADQKIRLWNASTGTCLETIAAGSQVCSLLWGHKGELVSAHGFALNQICVWQYPSMRKTNELRGHTARVLHLALSPDGTTIVSAAGDETLSFWPVLRGSPPAPKWSDSPLRLALR